jgi:type II secretion system protein G
MNKRGFTLIELLVVIAILGLLSTLAVVALGSARTKSRDSKRLSDLKQLQTALELYYTENTAYPVGTAISLGDPSHICLNKSGWSNTISCAGAYMAKIPTGPNTGEFYLYTGATSTFTVTSVLEDSMGGLTGTVTLSPAGLTATSTTP